MRRRHDHHRLLPIMLWALANGRDGPAQTVSPPAAIEDRRASSSPGDRTAPTGTYDLPAMPPAPQPIR